MEIDKIIMLLSEFIPKTTNDGNTQVSTKMIFYVSIRKRKTAYITPELAKLVVMVH